MKVNNQALSLTMITLALSQGCLLSACAPRAQLDSTKKAAVMRAHEEEAKKKAQAGLPTPTGAPTPAPTPAATPSQPNAALSTGATTFATSFDSVDFSISSKTGTENSAQLNFTHWPTPAKIATIGPMVATLSAATAPSGADMSPPIGELGYSAHLACKGADCASATLALTKLQAPLDGKVLIHIDRLALTRQTIQASGTPKGVDAGVVAAFKSQGKIETLATLLKVENGAQYFKVESRFPSGAIVPGQPASDKERRVTVKGTLGAGVTITVYYVDTESDVQAGSHQDYKGTATYSDTDKAIKIELDGAGDDRLKSLSFDTPASS